MNHRLSQGRRYVLALFACFAVVFVLTACTAEPSRLVVIDEAHVLAQTELQAAAAPLLKHGATIAVIAVRAGDESDFTRRLVSAGLWRDGDIVPEVLGLYISFEPHYSELRAGSRWSEALPDEMLRTIRQNQLNPALRDGNPTSGVVATLAAFEAQIGWPFGIGLGPIVVAAIAVVVGWLVLGRRLEMLFWRLRDAWERSAPGRAAARLWQRTPYGRKQIAKQVGLARQKLEVAVDAAQREHRKLPGTIAGFEQALALLAHRRSALEQRATDDPTLAAELLALANDYQQKTTAIRKSVQTIASTRTALEKSSTTARETIGRVRGSFQKAAAPPKRSNKLKREIPPEAYQKLDQFQARYEQIRQEYAAIEQQVLTADQRLAHLRSLELAYTLLTKEIMAHWQTTSPQEYDQAIRKEKAAQARQAAHASSSAYAYDSSSYSSSTSYDSAASNSSYDTSSSSSDSSSSSSSSSDGGSW